MLITLGVNESMTRGNSLDISSGTGFVPYVVLFQSSKLMIKQNLRVTLK